MVEDRDYLIKLIKYVHLNPIRAKIVSNPEDFQWSSHKAYLGLITYSWLTTNHIYKKFNDSLDIARACFKKYIEGEPLSEVDLDQLRKGNQEEGMLGSDNFLEEILKATQSSSPKNYTLDQLIDLVCQVLELLFQSCFSQEKIVRGASHDL